MSESIKKSERIKLAQAFRAAKKHLARNGTQVRSCKKDWYICLALRSALSHKEIKLSQYRHAKRIIQERLDTSTTLEDWLVVKKILPEGYDHYADNFRQIQATRHRWVNSLIKEFSQP